MWTMDYSLETKASPHALWRLLSDVEGWGAWNEGIETITLHGALGVGASFAMTPPGEDMLTSTIVELEPDRLLTDQTVMGDLVIRVAHLLEPLPGGGTSITYRVQVDGSGSEAVEEEIGTAVSADFPQVIAALATAAVATSLGHQDR